MTLRTKDHGNRPTRTVSARTTFINALGKIIALLLVLALVVLIERYCSVQVEPFGPGADIVSIDGDTLRAANGDEYRLYAIDAPELKQACEEANGKEWLCGRAAKARLTALIKGGSVTCADRATDRFGRHIAVCSAAGIADLGEQMVRDGYAIALDLGGRPYATAELEARDAKRGIWRGIFERPADWRQAHPRVD